MFEERSAKMKELGGEKWDDGPVRQFISPRIPSPLSCGEIIERHAHVAHE